MADSSALLLEITCPVRRAVRYSFGASAEVTVLGSTEGLVSITRDLSAGGCFIKTRTPLSKETLIRLRITHSDSEVTALGEVTDNVTPEGMGVEFTGMEPQDRALRQTWLDQIK